MEVVMAITVGVLYAAGFYMILRRSLVKVIIGLALLSHASNLFLFTVGGLTRNGTPLISESGVMEAEVYADPLPQALILTAIVIGFGVQAFALVLFKRVFQTVKSDDLDELTTTEQAEVTS